MKRDRPTKYSFAHSSFVYNNIQNYRSKALIIDTRDTPSYSNQYIQNSINLDKNRVQSYLQIDFDKKDFSQATLEDLAGVLDENESSKFAERKRKFCMMIISENAFMTDFIQGCKELKKADETFECFEVSEGCFDDTLRAQFERIKQEDSVSFGLQLFQLLQKDKVRELHILVDGASEFFIRYPYMNMGLFNMSPVIDDSESECKIDALHDLPNDILGGKLFLGTFNHARQLGILKNLKISHVINAAHECHNVHEDKGITYHKIWVRDESSDNLTDHFQKAFEFISEVVEQVKEGGVLVHCALGKSRSASIVIMYIMKKFGWDLTKAMEYVKSRRAIVSPYEGFVNELKELEKRQLEF